jgi:hypothetical protein
MGQERTSRAEQSPGGVKRLAGLCAGVSLSRCTLRLCHVGLHGHPSTSGRVARTGGFDDRRKARRGCTFHAAQIAHGALHGASRRCWHGKLLRPAPKCMYVPHLQESSTMRSPHAPVLSAGERPLAAINRLSGSVLDRDRKQLQEPKLVRNRAAPVAAQWPPARRLASTRPALLRWPRIRRGRLAVAASRCGNTYRETRAAGNGYIHTTPRHDSEPPHGRHARRPFAPSWAAFPPHCVRPALQRCHSDVIHESRVFGRPPLLWLRALARACLASF